MAEKLKRLSEKDFFLSLQNFSGVQVQVTDASIELTIENSPVCLMANLGNVYGFGSFFSCTINSLNDNGEKVEPFETYRASLLERMAVDYFDIVSSSKYFHPITGFKFCWKEKIGTRINTNHTMYSLLREQYLHQGFSLVEAQKMAAFGTWEIEKVAVPTRFTKMRAISEIFLKKGTTDQSILHSIDGVIYRE